jgi:RNA polymerase sigma-70 factor (ECF subfamily)
VSITDLIKGCKQGNRKSQQALYLQYADQVMSIAYRYARDLSEAEDILQNAFIKIFSNIHSFDPKKGKFDAWLSRLVINEALQLLKKNRRYFLINSDNIERLDQAVDADAMSSLAVEDIHKLLHQLPDGYRAVFNLYVIEEYSHQEIAALLDITASASRSQLARAKKMLRKLIEQQKNVRHAV